MLIPKIMETEQEHVDRSFPPELSQWFTTPLQQTSIIYASPPPSITLPQQQSERTLQIPVLDKPIGGSYETTDVAFVGYIMQPQTNQNQHQILEIQNISTEQDATFRFQPRPLNGELNPNDYLSVIMFEPKLKDAATNTDENWDAKKSSKPVITVPELTVLEQRFHCQYCVKDFSTLADLMNHGKCVYHDSQKPRERSYCEKKVASSSNVMAQKSQQKVSSIPYLCQICNVFFSNSDIFLKHEQSHRINSVKKYNCDPCGLEFTDENVHKKHLKIHSDFKYTCNICDKMFASSSTCDAHKRIHTEERPFKCDLCDKRFFTKSHMRTHRRVHSGERPFACNICGRAFADGSSHRRHERLHQQNKKYQCEVCNRGFPLAMSLSKHMAKHHSYNI